MYPSSAQAHPLSAGRRVADYEIQSVLGVGGFGITYRAFDCVLEQPVAIKEYFPDAYAQRDPDGTTVMRRRTDQDDIFGYGLERFLDEARTLAKFRDAGIVRVQRYLQAHGTAYLVMDYEEGNTLEQRLKDSGSQGEDWTQEIAIALLEGLQIVHAKGYLHRDIKPANVLLRRDGSPVLLDFGAARQALEQQAKGFTVMLTPGYAPVEQYDEEQAQGPWTDLYALGATMYHCLMGDRPPEATRRLLVLGDQEPDPIRIALQASHNLYSQRILDTMLWLLEPIAERRPRSAEAALNYLAGSHDQTVVQPRAPTASSAAKTRDEPGSTRTVSMTRPGLEGLPNTEPPHASEAIETRAQDALMDNLVAVAEQQIAQSLGPIAKILVKRARQQCQSADEFCSVLAEELPSAEERAAFLVSLKKVRSSSPP